MEKEETQVVVPEEVEKVVPEEATTVVPKEVEKAVQGEATTVVPKEVEKAVPGEVTKVVPEEEFVEGTTAVEGREGTRVVENILLEEREEVEEEGHWEEGLCDIHSSDDTHNPGSMLLHHLPRKQM